MAKGGKAGNCRERLRGKGWGVRRRGRVAGAGRQDWAATLMLSQQTIQKTDVETCGFYKW